MEEGKPLWKNQQESDLKKIYDILPEIEPETKPKVKPEPDAPETQPAITDGP